MFRSVAFVLLFSFASCHFWHHEHNHGCGGHDHLRHRHPWHRQQQEDNEFDRLAQCVISADTMLQNSCMQNGDRQIRVYPGLDFYVLKYSLDGFSEGHIDVKIKHRVIYVTAGQDEHVTFKDLRILPDSVKSADSSWYFEDGTLRVLMPYINPPKTEAILTCGDIKESVITVPKITNTENDLRFLGVFN